MITAVAFFAEGLMLKGMTPGSIVMLPMRVELVEFMRRERGDAE